MSINSIFNTIILHKYKKGINTNFAWTCIRAIHKFSSVNVFLKLIDNAHIMHIVNLCYTNKD